MARHLHAVPPPGAVPAPRPRGASRALSLTPDEVRHLRASIRNVARVRYGTLRALADALGVHPVSLTRRKRPSAALAVAVWRLTGIPVEALLTGKLAVVPATLDAAPPDRTPA